MATVPGNGHATGGLWVTVSDLARAKGIDKGAISRRLARFEAEGIVSTRPGPRNSKLVNAAEFDKASGEVGDTLRAVIGDPAAAAPADDDTPTSSAVLTAERARREGYQADLARLELDARLGKLLPVVDVEAAMVRCAEALLRPLDSLHSRAGDLVSAVDASREAGARSMLKQLAFELRTSLAAGMRLLASAETDDAGDASTRPT